MLHDPDSLTPEPRDFADRQIDQLVYELRGLTDEETRILEQTTRER